MANYSDAVNEAFKSGDPMKTGSDNLYKEYQEITRQSGSAAANKFLSTESSNLKSILPDLALEWGISKFDPQSGVGRQELNSIAADDNPSNGYDQTMAKQVLLLAQDRSAGGLGGASQPGYDGIDSGAFHQTLGQDNPQFERGADANPDLVKAIDLNLSKEQIATYANLGAADAQQTAAAREINVTNAEQAATAAIPTDRSLTSTEVSQVVANQSAQQDNLAGIQANKAATSPAVVAGQQNIAKADDTIANNGFTTSDNLLVKPGPNAIADGKIKQSDVSGDTTDDTGKQNGLCAASDSQQYKAKPGDTLWGIAAKLLNVPNDKAHARDIYTFTKMLEAGNPNMNPKRIQIGETINYASNALTPADAD